MVNYEIRPTVAEGLATSVHVSLSLAFREDYGCHESGNGVNFENCSSSSVGTTWDRSQLRLPAPVEDPRCRHAAPVIQVNRVDLYYIIVHNQRSDSYLMLRHYSSSFNMYIGGGASPLRRRSSDIRGRLSSCGWKSCNIRNPSLRPNNKLAISNAV